MKIVDLTLQELGENLQLPKAFEFPVDIAAEVAQQVLRAGARALRFQTGLFGFMFGPARPLGAEEAEYRRRHGENGQYDASTCDVACAHQRASRGEFPFTLHSERLLRRLVRLALMARIAARLDDRA